MSDDKKGERKGIRLNEDHERGGNSGFQVVVVKYKSSWHAEINYSSDKDCWSNGSYGLKVRIFSVNKIACSLSKLLRMETKEDMEAIMEKIPKGKAEMELKVVARYNSWNPTNQFHHP